MQYQQEYQPNLFICDIGNASASQIVRVIEDLGFGRVSHVDFRGKTAIVVMYYWDIPFTTATRTLLQEGRPLLLYYSENRFWKAYAYKSYEQRNQEKQIQQMLEYERRVAEQRLIEEQRLAEEEDQRLVEEEEQRLAEEEEQRLAEEEEQRLAEEEEDKKRMFDVDMAVKKSIVLDYGNAAEMYPIIRDKYKAIFSKMRMVNSA